LAELRLVRRSIIFWVIYGKERGGEMLGVEINIVLKMQIFY
jgi:hypothetical protein